MSKTLSNQCLIYHKILLVFTILISSCSGTKSDSNKEKKDCLLQSKILRDTTQYFVFEQIHAHLKGMVSEFVFKAFEDKKGNFWFCTNHDGIIKYDGNKLVKFDSNNGIGGSAVRTYISDGSDTIWFGTSKGLTRYDGQNFKNFLLGSSSNDNEIWSIAKDADGIIWVASNSGVSKFDGHNFESFNLPRADLSTAYPMISSKRVAGIFIDSKGIKWFITDGYGVTKYDNKNFECITRDNGLPDNNITTIFEDSKENIWIGTFNEGVSKYDGKHFSKCHLGSKTTRLETANFCEDKHGNIWFTAEGMGVYKYDGKHFKLYTTKNGLTTNTIQHIYEDKKGQIWFFTWQGISVFDGNGITDISEKESWTK